VWQSWTQRSSRKRIQDAPLYSAPLEINTSTIHSVILEQVLVWCPRLSSTSSSTLPWFQHLCVSNWQINQFATHQESPRMFLWKSESFWCKLISWYWICTQTLGFH
jgi:hypothetical protein